MTMSQVKPDRPELPAGAQYHEAIARNWTAGYQRRGFRRRLAVFSTLIGERVQDGQRWLDLGCGSGVLTRMLLDRGAQVTAIDGSPAMLQQARTLLGSDAAAVAWFEADVEQLDALSLRHFDGVLCSSVIEYVNDPDALLGGISSALAPGGVVIISLPPKRAFVRTLQKFARRLAAFTGRELFGYLSVSRFEIAPTDLRNRLARHGLDLECVERFDPLLPSVSWRMLRPSLLICAARRLAIPPR